MAYTKSQRTLVRSILLGVLTIAIAVFISKQIQKANQKPPVSLSFQTPIVEVLKVVNGSERIELDVEGRLKALNRIELYAEVAGILVNSGFREGAKFNQGQAIVRINDTEFGAQLKAQRSAFIGGLNATLPDIALDFSEEYQSWKRYAKSIDINRTIPAMPSVEGTKLEQFLSGRGILNSYYSLKSQEARLGKYTLTAPFTGVLSQASLEPGTQVRPGQLLGVYIQEGVYELLAPVPPDNVAYLKIGDKVELVNPENAAVIPGEISRINSALDPLTQMINIYVGVKSNELRDGMYLSAKLDAGELENCVKVDQRLFSQSNSLFVCSSDSLLREVRPEIIYRGKEVFYVRGLKEGSLLLKKNLNGAHVGMKVTPLMVAQNEAE